MFERFLAANVGFTTCLGVFGVKLLVLQHVWMFLGCKRWFYSMFGRFWGENVGMFGRFLVAFVGFTACLDVFSVKLLFFYSMLWCFCGVTTCLGVFVVNMLVLQHV